jgi:hypothetical protein
MLSAAGKHRLILRILSPQNQWASSGRRADGRLKNLFLELAILFDPIVYSEIPDNIWWYLGFVSLRMHSEFYASYVLPASDRPLG